MRGPEQLLKNENCWTTDMGACFPEQGRVVLRGKELFKDLQNLSWTGLLFYAVTGRIPEDNQVRLFEGIWAICNSYPDPRIWNNRVAALAGTARSTAALAIGAATAITEASIYGHRPTMRSIDFLYRTQQKLDQGADLTDLIMIEKEKYGVIPGYGRPLIQGKDERIDPLLALAKSLGFAEGPYIKLIFKIEEILLKSRWHLHMNIAALQAALAAEQGISCREYYLLRIVGYSAGILPCYLDAVTKTEASLFPMRCERITYSGESLRSWSNAETQPCIS
jgi:citrate synthase